MADYTDIDKLREQTRDAEPSTGPWTPFAYEDGPAPRTFVTDGQGRRHHVFSENAAQHLNQRDAAVAELVGLRTEVDQLRTDNERLREFIMAEREACSFDGPLPTGSWPDVALQLIRQLLGRRDALQAEVDAVEQAAREHLPEAVGHNTLAEILAGIARQRDWQREQKVALQARIDAVKVAVLEAERIRPDIGPSHDPKRREQIIGRTAMNAVIRLVGAALGVDPQKEEQQ